MSSAAFTYEVKQNQYKLKKDNPTFSATVSRSDWRRCRKKMADALAQSNRAEFHEAFGEMYHLKKQL
jgi:hypothetical protein